MQAALCMSLAQTARMTYFCICGMSLSLAPTKGFARTDHFKHVSEIQLPSSGCLIPHLQCLRLQSSSKSLRAVRLMQASIWSFTRHRLDSALFILFSLSYNHRYLALLEKNHMGSTLGRSQGHWASVDLPSYCSDTQQSQKRPCHYRAEMVHLQQGEQSLLLTPSWAPES